MAKHEFGIMPAPPQKGKRYDDYEPQKYNCISIVDEIIEAIDKALIHIDFYHHTVDIKSKGLAYCGVTLISPQSLSAFIEAINGYDGVYELKKTAETALEENKWLIHFGL